MVPIILYILACSQLPLYIEEKSHLKYTISNGKLSRRGRKEQRKVIESRALGPGQYKARFLTLGLRDA